jgi:hypothetical protein
MSAGAAPPPPERLAAAVAALAARVGEPEARAQLHALGALLDGYEPEAAGAVEGESLEESIRVAIEAEDEPGLVRAMRELAGLDRAAVRGVNWSAASGG